MWVCCVRRETNQHSSRGEPSDLTSSTRGLSNIHGNIDGDEAQLSLLPRASFTFANVLGGSMCNLPMSADLPQVLVHSVIPGDPHVDAGNGCQGQP